MVDDVCFLLVDATILAMVLKIVNYFSDLEVLKHGKHVDFGIRSFVVVVNIGHEITTVVGNAVVVLDIYV